MRKLIACLGSAVLIAAAGAAVAQTALAPTGPVGKGAVTGLATGSLSPGHYTCIAGYRPMLTLGEMTIEGGKFRFHPPTGPTTAGTYVLTAGGIRWSGDIGAITNSQITESGLDASKPDFWFKYLAYAGAKSPTTAACQKL